MVRSEKCYFACFVSRANKLIISVSNNHLATPQSIYKDILEIILIQLSLYGQVMYFLHHEWKYTISVFR